VGRGSSTVKSPGGELDDPDYSLSVSDLNSMYEASGGKHLGLSNEKARYNANSRY
jgi:hypothetical protein